MPEPVTGGERLTGQSCAISAHDYDMFRSMRQELQLISKVAQKLLREELPGLLEEIEKVRWS
jgi:hypothetical protein